MSVRLRRLTADLRSMETAFATHPAISIVSHEGSPPERYVVEFRVRCPLPPVAGAEPAIGLCHRAEIFLPMDYPRRSPFCRMVTPVHHPNVDPQKICIGDHWSAGQSLARLVVHIAEMLCYQSYNVRSPLNATAAVWADVRPGTFPLQADDLMQGV